PGTGAEGMRAFVEVQVIGPCVILPYAANRVVARGRRYCPTNCGCPACYSDGAVITTWKKYQACGDRYRRNGYLGCNRACEPHCCGIDGAGGESARFLQAQCLAAHWT